MPDNLLQYVLLYQSVFLYDDEVNDLISIFSYNNPLFGVDVPIIDVFDSGVGGSLLFLFLLLSIGLVGLSQILNFSANLNGLTFEDKFGDTISVVSISLTKVASFEFNIKSLPSSLVFAGSMLLIFTTDTRLQNEKHKSDIVVLTTIFGSKSLNEQ